MKLSICITTFNRALFIGETLESILAQMTDDCEIVVLDGASTDDTERVVSAYTDCFDRVSYIKQSTNNGFDRDCDRVVETASGEYCWLLADDDCLRPGAVAAVLKALHQDLSLLIVNLESRDFSMSRVIQTRWLDFESNRTYGGGDMDRLFVDVGDALRYVGCVVIKREVWIARERRQYYGSLFVYLGVIFQQPLPGEAMVLAEPLVSYRMGNSHTWSAEASEILFSKWPNLVESLAISASAKRMIHSVEPWRHPGQLLLWRGLGFYSVCEYRKWVRPRLHSTREMLIPVLAAALPGFLLNALFIFYYSCVRRRGNRLQALRESPFYWRNWRTLNRQFAH